MQAQPSGTKIPGYRVRIFLDNGQNARASANGAIARFREIYPDIPAYLSYENPYFKVTVGNCLTSEEAIILLGKIRDAFDRAFLVREEISLSLFGETASSIPTSNGTSEPAIRSGTASFPLYFVAASEPGDTIPGRAEYCLGL